jgi:hypothetical protein
MGAFSLAILVGCLDALRWLAWGAALLVAALIVTQHVRQDENAMPAAQALLAGGLLATGMICGLATRMLRRRRPD